MEGIPVYDEQFNTICIFASGGCIRVHQLVDAEANDYTINFYVAFVKAISGSRVDILPVLAEKDPFRAIVYYDAKLNKNPDLRVDGLLCEVEHPCKPEKLNNLKHRIEEGAAQADYIILAIDTPIDINLMRRACKGKFIDFKKLECVEFLNGRSSVKFRRQDFIYGKKEPIL